MADLAVLGLEIRSDSVPVAGKRLDDFERQAVRTDRTADRVAKTIGRMAAQFAALAAVTFSFNTMIREARAFDAALAEVSTLLPVVEGEIDAIAEASRRMSREFGTTAASQAQAFYQAISAGAGDAAQATELLEVANRTAIGGITQVTVAVDILTTATNAYAASGLTASDAADTLFVGMRAGKTTIDELASTLGRVIPQATAVGLSFDEIVAATAALTTQGQSTEMAVTGLSGIMTQLLKPSSQAVDLAKELGIEFSATAAQTMGLAGFMEYLVEATGGSQEALAMLFGSTEALRAVFSLAGQGGEKFNDILADMEDRAGAADEAFNRVSQSLDQRLNVALSTIADVALGMGMTLLEYVVPGLEAAANAAQFLADNSGTVGEIAIIAGAGLGTYAVAATGAAVATGTFTAAIGLLGTTIAVLTGPAGALALAAAGIAFMVIKMGDVKSPAEEAADAIDEVDKALNDVKDSEPAHTMALMKTIQAHLDAANAALANAMAEREYLSARRDTLHFLGEDLPGGGGGQDIYDRTVQNNASEIERLMTLIGDLEARRRALGETLMDPVGGAITDEDWSEFNNPPKLPGKTPLKLGGGSAPQLNAYQEATQAVLDNIAALERQQQAFGLSETAADRFNTAMDLLGAAQEAGIPITDELIGEINELADAHAVAGEAARKMADEERKANEQLEFNRNTFNGFFQDMKNGLIEGKSFWQALGDAGANALDKITSRLLEMATDGLFDMLMGAFGGAFGGSLGGSFVPSGYVSGGYYPGLAGGGVGASGSFVPHALGDIYNSPGLSAYSGQVVSSPTFFPFANGIGLMGEAGPEAIMPLRRGPDGRLGVAANGNGAGSGSVLTVRFVDDSGKEVAQAKVQDGSAQSLDVTLDQIVARKIASPGSETSRALQQRYGLNGRLASR